MEDGSERVIYGTTDIKRMPKEERPTGTRQEENSEHIKFFDMELSDWSSCIYSKILEVRIKKGFYKVCT